MCPHTTTSAAGTSLMPRANTLVITHCVEVLSSFPPSFFLSPPSCFLLFLTLTKHPPYYCRHSLPRNFFVLFVVCLQPCSFSSTLTF